MVEIPNVQILPIYGEPLSESQAAELKSQTIFDRKYKTGDRIGWFFLYSPDESTPLEERVKSPNMRRLVLSIHTTVAEEDKQFSDEFVFVDTCDTSKVTLNRYARRSDLADPKFLEFVRAAQYAHYKKLSEPENVEQ